MIKIYLLDFSGAAADGVYRTALPSYIENTQNAVLKKERIFSYILLSYAYEKSFPLPMPNISAMLHPTSSSLRIPIISNI